MIVFLYIFFFFSSRRRHTRWTGDWSSDVCSSDLLRGPRYARRPARHHRLHSRAAALPARKRRGFAAERSSPSRCSAMSEAPRLEQRSEEHTSELQSPVHLVCRLLLEKKKKKKHYHQANEKQSSKYDIVSHNPRQLHLEYESVCGSVCTVTMSHLSGWWTLEHCVACIT